MLSPVLLYKKQIVVAALFCILLGVLFAQHTDTSYTDIATVTRGTVTETIGISGFVETTNAADIAFPTVGTVTGVLVHEGDQVTTGQLLATLGSKELVAEREAATASVLAARAEQSALQSGPTSESRAVTEATLAAAKSALLETQKTEVEKIELARRALLSNNLTAKSTDPEEPAAPPTISGTYRCETEGVYILSIYRSGTDSGFSYSLSGLETGLGTVSVTQPAAIGTCGLFAEFTPDENYADSAWTISIPNTESATYVTYKNAYELAKRQATQNIAAAETALTLAQNSATAATAAPRIESLITANAAITAAEARVNAIDAQLANFSITAPFDGVITDVTIVPGETANLTPVLTMLGTTTYSLTARVPEIDITKVATNQAVRVRFDADSQTTYAGIISFVSPLPTTIDGVAYFDATIELATTPAWIRAGLNADVDITINESADTLRIPTRFVLHDDSRTYVYLLTNNEITPVDISIVFTGNDGYVAVDGVAEGDTVVLPPQN